MKIWFWTLIIALTMLNVHHAVAGNGMDRGGGDYQVSLGSLLPRTIDLAFDIDYRKAGSTSIVPTLKPFDTVFFGFIYTRPDFGRFRIRLYRPFDSSTEYEVLESSLRFLDTLKEIASFTSPQDINSLQHQPLAVRLNRGANDSVKIEYAAGYHIDDLWTALSPDQDLTSLKISLKSYAWLDGQELIDPRGDGLSAFVSRMRAVQFTLFKQADLASISEARRALWSLRQLGTTLNQLRIWARFPAELSNGEQLFLQEMRRQKEELLDLAKSALRTDGACEPAVYARFISKLTAWNVGSSAYFAEILDNQPVAWISADTRIRANRLRQLLRADLKSSVAPYCELSGIRSKIDLILDQE